MFESIKNHVINWLVPDYFNLKKENQRLKQDIYYLVRKENGVDASLVRMKWSVRFDLDDALWAGDRNSDDNKFMGIASHIS